VTTTVPSGHGTPDLTIERIETVALRVPLDRVYKGSHYSMSHRSTILTRVHTASGVSGRPTPVTRTQGSARSTPSSPARSRRC
jgi:hypothetical protein